MPSKRSKKMTREQERSLDIEIGFLEGVVRRDPAYIDALQILGDNYTRRGRFEDGLKVDEQLVRLRPADALVHYNLACYWSLAGNVKLAVAYLSQAFDLEPEYRDLVTREADFDPIRNHPHFLALTSVIV